MNTKALRQKVLDLAIHGKLVPQNPNDESATVLLEKIRAEKAEKIKKGELKADKKDSFIFVGSDKRHYEQFADGTVKDIEDDIPFDVPEGWAWCRLRNIGEYKKGPFGSSLTKSMFVPKSEKTVKVYEQKNAIQKDHTLGEYYITRDYFESQMQGFEVFSGDILVSCAGTIGETYILPDNIEQGIINQALMKMKITSLINTDYFLMFFDHILKEESANNGKGTAIKNIPPFDIFKNFLFPLPSYSEQKRIIESVTNIFSIIDNLENNKSDLQSLIKSTKSKILDLAIHGKLVPQDPNDEPAEELLKRITTSDNRPYEKVDEVDYEIPKSWRFCKIKDVCSVIMGQSPEGEAVSDDKNGMEFHQGKICFGEKYLEESSSFTKHITKIAPKDSVLLCVRAPVGIVNITEREICIGRGLCAVIPKYEINSDFWFYWLQSLQSDFEQKATGTTFRAISVDVIKNQIVAIPPHEEQNRIVNKINELYEQLDKIVLNLV